MKLAWPVDAASPSKLTAGIYTTKRSRNGVNRRTPRTAEEQHPNMSAKRAGALRLRRGCRPLDGPVFGVIRSPYCVDAS